MTERVPDRDNDRRERVRTSKVRWEPARPGVTHAIGTGPKGLEALRQLGRRLADKKGS